ncbi:MAG: hypothetical protein V1859_00320 [archaeon]
MAYTEQSLLEQLADISLQAQTNGWNNHGSRIRGLSGDELESELALAIQAYTAPSYLIAQGLLIENSSSGFMRQLRLATVAMNINVADAQRRAGGVHLDEAVVSLEESYELARKFNDPLLTARGGNFLSLAYSAQGYRKIKETDYKGALAAFQGIERLFQNMDFDAATGKTALMMHANMAENYLNMVRIIEIGSLDNTNVNLYLNLARENSEKAKQMLDDLNYTPTPDLPANEMANWYANVHAYRGKIVRYKRDFSTAIDEFSTALRYSQGGEHNLPGANYPLQVAVLQTELLYTVMKNDQPQQDVEVSILLENVTTFRKEQNFGDLDAIYEPMLTEVRQYFTSTPS